METNIINLMSTTDNDSQSCNTFPAVLIKIDMWE